ncbi:2-polyprenyl-6-methoxyphenol hydroxylase-related FAD-dependent oxidoreductase [Legionella oakridgensis ATCC 33761 = DSM 21215]|uniref:2-polyprenyl-6-methoxyphenol hydroxylase-related FAD-dependent oxidoreductase n=1 Tax=Legionella oakridgensis ATCC 33761 = DSM 21215 TaxID=1268635 RepID=W0B576_9GAMM|nr:2-polyprenyl-6-methoxyphenol hydroxylase-related FAD-dependent oxidoreductase [Legionella oakridgensis ATCC 33761 = DSM 21215]
MADRQVDILIIGGGLTGATLMLALANAGYQTLLVEARPFSDKAQVNFDARTLALSPASARILQMLNVWPELVNNATAIESIHVSEKQQFGSTKLHSDKKIRWAMLLRCSIFIAPCTICLTSKTSLLLQNL